MLRLLLDKELISEATIDNLLSWNHSGFSVHGSVWVEDRQGDAARGKRSKAALAGDTTETSGRQDDDEFTRRARLTWAKLIRRVYEVDPLLCPFCGGEMKILAFILDFGAAKAIRKSLELPAQEPEPLAHAPPETLELIVESA